MDIHTKLKSNDSLTRLAKSYNLNTWNQLTNHIKDLPYGRNTNRSDFELVLKEGKGTCSSKHAFLKQIADLNNLSSVRLILGIYKMNNLNTPKIGDLFNNTGISYIPEVHCYLKIEDNYVDYTSTTSTFNNIKNDILQEIEITPKQVSEFKVTYHKTFLKTWINEHDIPFSFDELWSLRETCIANLSN